MLDATKARCSMSHARCRCSRPSMLTLGTIMLDSVTLDILSDDVTCECYVIPRLVEKPRSGKLDGREI